MVQRKVKCASHWEWTCRMCKKAGALERVGRIRSQKQFTRLYQDAYADHKLLSKNCRSAELSLVQIDGRTHHTDV